MECDQKVRAYTTIEGKLVVAQETIETKNLFIKDKDQQLNQLQLVQESEKALINGLQSEKKHLELTLRENQTLKEQYKLKCD